MKRALVRRLLVLAGLASGLSGGLAAGAQPPAAEVSPAGSATTATTFAPSPSASSAVAPSAPPVDGVSLLTRWLRASPEVAGWRTQVGAARFDAVTAAVWPNPELQLSGAGLVTGAPPDGDYGINVQVTAPLPVFGQRGARKEAAEKLVGVAEANVAGHLWDRASDIHEAMVEQAFAAARVATYERSLDELSRLQRIVGLRSREGASGRYDVLRTSTQEATLQASMRNSAIDRDQAESRLLGLIADASLKAAPMTPDGLPHLANLGEGDLVTRALAHRPDFLQAKRSEGASQAEAQRQRKEVVPTPSVFVQSLTIGRQFGWQVTGGVSFPVPVTDRRQGAIGRALEEARGHALWEVRTQELELLKQLAEAEVGLARAAVLLPVDLRTK